MARRARPLARSTVLFDGLPGFLPDDLLDSSVWHVPSGNPTRP